MSERRPKIVDFRPPGYIEMNSRRKGLIIVGAAFGGVALTVGVVFGASECLASGPVNKGENSSAATTVEPNEVIASIVIPPSEKDPFRLSEGVYGEEMYKTDGVRFRRTIKFLFSIGDRNTIILRETYDKIKQKTNGVEYLQNGEVFAPKPGDVYFIDDPDRTRQPGIYLRENPTIFPDYGQDNVFLYDWMAVKITSESKSVKDQIGNEKTMWPVEVVELNSAIVTDVVAPVGSNGWVSQEWLGQKARLAQPGYYY